MKGRNQPPGWAQRLLRWYCKTELLEDLEGDLHEYFVRHVRAKGLRRARWIYILDVLKFIRTYTVRELPGINVFLHTIMIQSYIKTSTRSLMRNKLFSGINILGLAVSMSVGLIIIAMLADLYAYDKFHDKHDRIYRVVSQYKREANERTDFVATTSLKSAKAIQQSFASVDDIAILHAGFSGDVAAGEVTVPLSGFWANDRLFNVFSFKLLQGNASSALKMPFSVVLTETSARKLFGHTNALGKIVTLNGGREYTVTGVMKDIPVFSHIKFEMLGSLTTREITMKEDENEMEWGNIWYTWAYVLLPPEGNMHSLKKELADLSAQENSFLDHGHVTLALQPLDDIVIGENYGNQIGQVMGRTPVWILGSLSFIVILSACLNYTNLSIARSFRRSREVGIRKTIGALKRHITTQFLVESVLISLFALIFSLLIFLFIKPHFISMEPSLQALLVLKPSALLIAFFILFATSVGILAGIFPAFFFAGMNAVQILKGLSSVPIFKGLTMRKVLIGFQYCISIIAICATIIIYKQYRHFTSYDLGFNTENVLNIRLQGNRPALMQKELMELPEVKEVSSSKLVQGIGNYWHVNMKAPHDPNDSATVYFNMIDEHYLPLHDYKFLAGRNFTNRADSAAESEVIVNESVLKRFNIAADPQQAIHQTVVVDQKELRIVGVLKDFEYGRANNRTRKEVIMRYSNDADYLNVKIVSSDVSSAYAKIEAAWKKIDPVHPMEAKFYEAQIEETFVGLKASAKVGGFLAFLIICIASIGLFGMAVFTTETRLKEISIRKVLGASEGRLLYVLSKGFLVLLMIATAIAAPVTYLFFDSVLLPQIANHAPISIGEMVAGVMIVMSFALLMIGFQTLKTARTNPARTLRSE